jgi:adenylate cyclase
MKKRFRDLKKFGVYTLLSLSISILLSLSFTSVPETLQSIDNSLRDYMFHIRGELPKSENIVIVDIDEKSLKEIGQWPWSRDVVSNILINLTNAGVGIIGFDIVFAEEDRTSPHKVLKDLNIETKEAPPNYDEYFAYVISQTPTILGYQFQMEKESYLESKSPITPAIIIQKHKKEIDDDVLLKAEGSILNIPMLQNNAYSSGFFNNIPDPSGTVRSVPMLISYNNEIYPSLSLEVVRAISGSKKVVINYLRDSELAGIENIQIGQYHIPTDELGRLLVNFRGKEGSFKYISALDIVNNKFDKSLIDGKIVLIGTSAAGLLDLRATPVESIYPGVEVHANAIDNILTGELLSKDAGALGQNLLIITLIVFLTIFTIAYVSAIYMPFILASITLTTLYALYYQFTIGNVLNILFPIIAVSTSTVLGLIINYFLEKRNELLIKKKFASKVSKEVMESLLENPENNTFEAMDKEITVFFSDIRSFTSISESMPSARALINYLNEYMTPMSNIIIEEKGTIDKYIGDAIMAYWNAPGEVENHPDRALSAAIKQIEYLEPLNKQLKEKNLPRIEIGIGLNTGVATVGEMGSEQRSDYTCIGDAINLGSRLESLCKPYGAKIIISEYVKDRLKENYLIRNLDLVRVKGKTKPVEIFEVLGFKNDDLNIENEILKFNNAIKQYRKCNFREALDFFQELDKIKLNKNNIICKLYIDRCKEYIENTPENFDGVYTHTTKG